MILFPKQLKDILLLKPLLCQMFQIFASLQRSNKLNLIYIVEYLKM